MNDKDERGAILVEALEETQGLLAAMLHETRSADEIAAQLGDNRTALQAYARAASTSANVAQLDMSLEARLTDAEADVKRLHAEKMELWNQVHGYSANVAQGAVAVEAREIQQYVLSVLPSVYYMDPPDGGSVSVLEQLRRMADDAAKYRASTAQTADVAQGEEAVMLDDLSTLVVRLVRVLRKASPDSDLPEKALGYLYRKNLAPAVLRGGAFGEYAAPPAQTAITVTPAMVKAAIPWLTGLHHMRNTDAKAHIEEAIKAALTAAQSASGDTK